MLSKMLLVVALCLLSVNAFTAPRPMAVQKSSIRFMSEEPTETTTSEIDPMAEAMDSEQSQAMERARKADELRSQEVFMKKSTGKFACMNCDWVFDETKGDSMMIGGQIKPGTPFTDLPSNWRCPVCRASKDSFREDMIEIPGFAVNQGYGFGTNGMTAGQKNGLVFGGLAAFFVLFIGGYALN